MVGTLLTVVVPTIPGRESLLSRCLSSITAQAPGTVEVLVVAGRGQLGDKVNMAAHLARGEYLTVVDDDDFLSDDYMAEVLPRCAGVDFVGFKIAQYLNGDPVGEAFTRGDLDVFGVRAHGPTPKGVTRSDIWRRVPMRNFYTADRKWCATVAPLIETHAFIDRCLYVYDFWDVTSAFVGEGIGRDVGEWDFDPSNVHHLTLG